jgi:ABC-type branched-subunit amino acid transport system substrate-binding protein
LKKHTVYRGALSAAQIAAGMNAALRNARRLVKDARVLVETGAFPSAASLAILAIEEAGKSVHPSFSCRCTNRERKS